MFSSHHRDRKQLNLRYILQTCLRNLLNTTGEKWMRKFSFFGNLFWNISFVFLFWRMVLSGTTFRDSGVKGLKFPTNNFPDDVYIMTYFPLKLRVTKLANTEVVSFLDSSLQTREETSDILQNIR